MAVVPATKLMSKYLTPQHLTADKVLASMRPKRRMHKGRYTQGFPGSIPNKKLC